MAHESTPSGDAASATNGSDDPTPAHEVPWWPSPGRSTADDPTGAGPDPYGTPGPSTARGPYASPYAPAGAGTPHRYAGPYHGDPPYGPGGPYGGYSPYGQPPGDVPRYGALGHRYAWTYVPPPPPEAPVSADERRRRGRRIMALGGAIIVFLGAGIGIGAAVAPTSPASSAHALLAKAMSATAAAHSYHYFERTTLFGSPDDIEGVALQNGGRQLIRLRCGNGTNLFALRLVSGVVYFRGNRTAVIDQLGVSPARAATLAGRWVKVTKSEAPYSTFANGITTRSNVSQLPTVLVPRSTRTISNSSPPSTEVFGALYAGKGKSPIGTADLVIASSSSLPRTLRGSAVKTTGRYVVTWRWTNFGKTVSVPAPSGALPYSSLHVKPPAKNSTGCV